MTAENMTENEKANSRRQWVRICLRFLAICSVVSVGAILLFKGLLPSITSSWKPSPYTRTVREEIKSPRNEKEPDKAAMAKAAPSQGGLATNAPIAKEENTKEAAKNEQLIQRVVTVESPWAQIAQLAIMVGIQAGLLGICIWGVVALSRDE